ncbi:MAG: histone [Parachlamydiales bacterium]|nr:histone [Parachlamydiales bacterium]
MALKDVIKTMHHLLGHLVKDLTKAEGGNKAASQRVRTGSIKLEKVAKQYRKESVSAEKKGLFKKMKVTGKKHKPVKKAVKKAAKKPAKKKVAKKRR